MRDGWCSRTSITNFCSEYTWDISLHNAYDVKADLLSIAIHLLDGNVKPWSRLMPALGFPFILPHLSFITYITP
jgi:hypothetical protein